MNRRAGVELLGGALGALAAAIPIAALWGFSVDDALITARVAANIARGIGHRMNAGGAVVDAVTPLGYAWLLAPFAKGGALSALAWARGIGALSVVLATAWLGVRIARDGERSVRFAPLGVLAACVPFGAWAASGMETGVVTAFATLALARSRFAPLAAGMAAAWRPELLPWALVIALGGAVARRKHPSEAIGALALALAPVIAVGSARMLLFATPTPLAVLAKPSDLRHGLGYALNALVYAALPVLAVAPRLVRALPGHEKAVLAACITHLFAMVVAGGDWMTLYRLIVPVLPGWVLVGAAVAERSRASTSLARFAIALGLSVPLWLTHARAARSVLDHRLALIEAARPVLAESERVAAVDIGWLGAATDAAIVDLTGVSDPTVARLAGGHTTKRIQEGFVRARAVDTVVLLVDELAEPWSASRFAYGVEARIARQAAELGMQPVGVLPLGGTARHYLVLSSKAERP